MSRTHRHVLKGKSRAYWRLVDWQTWRYSQRPREILMLEDSLNAWWRYNIGKVNRRFLHKRTRRRTKDALHNRQYWRIPMSKKEHEYWS